MRLRNKPCDTGANGSYSYHPKQADWSIKDELYVWLKYQRQSWAEEGGVRACLVAQSCPTLRDPRDCSPPGSSVLGIFQARILKWVAIPFSKGFLQPRDRTQVSCIAGRYFTPWATREAPREAEGLWQIWHLTGPVYNRPVEKSMVHQNEKHHLS